MKYSDCCGAPAYSNGDSSTEDIGICPECKEHCEYMEEEEPDGTDDQFPTKEEMRDRMIEYQKLK